MPAPPIDSQIFLPKSDRRQFLKASAAASVVFAVPTIVPSSALGRDGNVDVQTDKPLAGKRVLEVLKNNFDVQEKSRRELPKGPPGQ